MKSVIDLPPPPTIEQDRGGDDDRWTRLFRAASDIEAHLLAGRLNGAGIETRAIKERSTAAAWLHNGSNPRAPVDLWVRSRCLDDARIVLAEIAFDQPAKNNDGEGPRRRDWRTPVAWWTSAVALALALTGIALLQTADHLEECRSSAGCEPATSP
ncbi:MAG TPA: DUF2007 domain-containing protein [Actinomycetota bacterium]|nr:DUF2007 domain-containing protein [Actinomycetota bacterium]